MMMHGLTNPKFKHDMIYLLTAIGLTPGGSTTVHICTQTVHRTTQLIWEECGPCPVFASYTLIFALRLRKKHGKTSVRVAGECNNNIKYTYQYSKDESSMVYSPAFS
jgi:hypothetical protein